MHWRSLLNCAAQLVEICLERIAKSHAGSRRVGVLDLGTGSGCILLSLAAELARAGRPAIEGVGVDASEGALDVARRNAAALGVGEGVQWLHSNWWEAVRSDAVFDVVVSNPPYVASEEMELLMADVREYVYCARGGFGHC